MAKAVPDVRIKAEYSLPFAVLISSSKGNNRLRRKPRRPSAWRRSVDEHCRATELCDLKPLVASLGPCARGVALNVTQQADVFAEKWLPGPDSNQRPTG